jgi:hypothetical protein
VPANVWISGHGFLLVWADGDVAQNPVTGGTNVDLHAGFTLDKDGETIAVFAADGQTVVATVTFGRQTQNVSQGWFPDGDGRTVYSMANFTPRAANTLAPIPAPRLFPPHFESGAMALAWEAVPGRVYRVEFTDDLSAWGWAPWGPPVTARTATETVTEVWDGWGRSRFYRVVLLP